MSSVVIAGNTSGSVTLAAPDVAGTTTLTLPDTSGTIVAPSSAGTSGQVLTSNGAGSNPTYQDLPAGGVTSLNGETGAITNTDYGAIGSYVIAGVSNYTNNLVISPNATVAGSSLTGYNGSAGNTTSARPLNALAQSNMNLSSSVASTLGLTGTWRSMTRGQHSTVATNVALLNLWVRIS